MNEHSTIPDHLLTWLDVERLLKQRTALWTLLPECVLSVDCFFSGMEIRHQPGTTEQVQTWLADIFGRSYLRDQNAIQLLIGAATYPVELVEDEDRSDIAIGRTYPLWREVAYLPVLQQGETKTQDIATAGLAQSSTGHASRASTHHAPNRFVEGPELISFHSFKGGVGRTTALMTYVAACLSDQTAGAKKVLVVDADLEAPGVTFWLDTSNPPTVSFVQLLEALHYPPKGVDDSLGYFAEKLRKTSLSRGGRQRELFILPAALTLGEIQDMPISPEHLARNPDNPWQLSDHLHSLGKLLGVDAVFIDLRAGLSELASPILFDPRVDHFFVSTVAPQSVLGMAEVLNRLYASNQQLPNDWREDARPTVVLSLLTRELRDSVHYENAVRTLGEAYPADDPLTPSVQWLEAEFLNTLMSLGSLQEALDALPQSQRLYASATDWARSLYANAQEKATAPKARESRNTQASRQELAARLKEVCEKAEFAEGDQSSQILATEPLLNLGKHFSSDLPSTLMIGAKGAGKTFTFRQIIQAGSWSAFLERLGFEKESTIDAAIFPALWSENIQDKPDGELKSSQNNALQKAGVSNANLLSRSDIRQRIDAALKSPPEHWDAFWDELVAKQFGLSGSGLKEVNELLANRSARTVLVFDGIEDAFGDAEAPPADQAIQALLRMTNRISELTNPHLGVLVFVRIDYVQATIRQNVGQLLQRFNPFRLHWNPESFLRLAYMLSSEAGVIESEDKAENLHMDALKTALESLWGKKLGGEKSKEAHSARWVYTALSDLRGNVQARDLVRFLKFAADEETGRTGQTWPDRLLAPESMRKAIPRCSEEKVKEAKAEIAPLRKWTKLMARQEIRNPKVPFSAKQAALDPSLLKSLQEIGVIYEDLDGKQGEERLFLPEIFRSGLGFETSAAGRPRMQALLKKNIGVIPL